MLIIPGKVIRSLGSASVAINALVVHKVAPGLVVRPLLLVICHTLLISYLRKDF